MIRSVVIDGAKVGDWDSFHDAFAQAFGFPAFYGRNLDAWIDCMTHLDAPGLTGMVLDHGDLLLVRLENAAALRASGPKIFAALLEASAFVNHRRVEAGEAPILILACDI